MERASNDSAHDDELSLELTLAAEAPAHGTPDDFFLCNAHKQERAVAKRRREAAAAATRTQESRSKKAGRHAATATRMPEPAEGKQGGSSSMCGDDDEVDLSLRL
ncbi:hypothetical protein VPH35_126513 [Triticum aestivum]